MENKSGNNYYTFMKIKAPDPTKEGLAAFTRKVNEQLEALSMKMYGNIEGKDLHSSVRQAIAKKVDDEVFSAELSLLPGQIAAEVTGKTTHIGPTAPTGDALFPGKEWWDTTTNELKRYTGSGWVTLDKTANSVYISASMKFNANGLSIQQVTIDGQPVDCVHVIGADRDGYYKLSTGEFIGGLVVRDGQLYVAASAMIDPRISDLAMRYQAYPSGIASLCFTSGSAIPLQFKVGGSANALVTEGPLIVWAVGINGESSLDLSASGSTWGAKRTVSGVQKEEYISLNPSTGEIFATHALTTTSDARKKQNIRSIADQTGAEAIIMALNPCQYEFQQDAAANGKGARRKVHYGFTAQDVKAAMDACGVSDWAAYSDADPERLGICYEEFIAPMVAVIQKQQRRIEGLESRLSALEELLKVR